MKNPMRFTIDKEQLRNGHINAYIPLGKAGIHLFISIKEQCCNINKRDYDLAWLDFADHSQDFDAYMEQIEWSEAIMFKYGYRA